MVATRTRAHLADIALPDIGMPDVEPLLPASLYEQRVQRLRAAMATRRYDHLVVWADREHSANLAYLTGFDPRFEEAILVVRPDGDPAVLVGNECAGMAAAAPLPMRPVMFQDMSLPGQPRDASAPLGSIIDDEGIPRGWSRRRRRMEDLRRSRHDRGARVPRRRAPSRRGRLGSRRERDRPPDRLGRRAEGDQRGRPDRGLRVGGMPDIGRSSPCSHRAAAGHDRA